MMLVCLPENFNIVLEYSGYQVPEIPAAKGKAPSNSFLKGILRTVLVSLAAAPPFYLSSPFILDFDIFMSIVMFIFALATVWLIPLFGWVVIASAAIVVLQLLVIGFNEFYYLYGYEQAIFLLAFVGIGYLVWFSWRSVKGKILPLLLED